MQKYNLNVRFVVEDDAPFILKMRNNKMLSRYLSSTDDDISKQINWISEYKKREKLGIEYYFIYELENGIKIGVNRIYNILDDSFELGSWLFEEYGENVFHPIYADIIAKEFGFDNLFLKNCYFDVRNNNLKVMKYHKIFNPIIIKQDEINTYFHLKNNTFFNNKNKILNIIYNENQSIS
jgi:hypothetical protein